MNTFYLFPSNAVLLGVVAGEFELLQGLKEKDSFDEIVYRRLRPFVPDQHRAEVPVEGHGLHLPPGHCWYDNGDGTENSGPDFSRTDDLNSEPTAQPEADGGEPSPLTEKRAPEYVRRNGKIFQLVEVPGKRNLIELLIEHVKGAKASDGSASGLMVHWRKLDDRADEPGSASDIGRKLRILADQNHLGKEYAFGLLLGRAFGECIVAEKRLVYMEEVYVNTPEEYLSVKADELDDEGSLETGLRESWTRLARNLSNDPIFHDCMISQDYLRSGKGFWGGMFFGLTRSDDPAASEINMMLCIRTTLCLILGHVVGWLYARDIRAAKDDAMAPIPRSLKLSTDASDETIAGQLQMVEQSAFNEQHGRQYLPETVIRQIANAVEGMSKQLWPAEFQRVESELAEVQSYGNGPKKGAVQEVLHRKKMTGTKLEKRFASAAEPLHALFRNVSEHKPDTFRCNWQEAHYFHVGVRLLLDLKNRIETERRRK